MERALIDLNITTHNKTTMGGMATIAIDHAWTGRMFDVRRTQSAESESPIAVALATAYIWNIVTTDRGQASGNAVGGEKSGEEV